MQIRREIVLALVVPSLVIAFTMALFCWPNAHLAPRDLPIGLVGPDQATAQLRDTLRPRGFEVRTYPDSTTATEAIGDRAIYGAVVADGQGIHVLIASAASPAVAELLRQVAAQTPSANEGAVPTATPVQDVVPLPSSDPRGAAFGAALLPILVSGTVLGGFSGRARSHPLLDTMLVLAGAMLVAVIGVLILGAWLKVLDSNTLGNWLAMAFSVATLAMVVSGAYALLGLTGLGIAAALNVLIGNPLSGAMSAPELLPGWAHAIGQLLPPGAISQLLRNTAYFDGHRITGPMVVLLVWIVIGVGLQLAGGRRAASRSRVAFPA